MPAIEAVDARRAPTVRIPEQRALPLREFEQWIAPAQEVLHHTGLHLINTRLWVDQLGKKYNIPITVDNIPETEWKPLFEKYDSFWFMGIYTPSAGSREHALKYADQYRGALPDLDPEKDVVASPYAIPEYSPNPKIAKDWDAWDSMVNYLHENGKTAILDFVPNHMAVDHPWASAHPEYFVQGTQDQFNQNPGMYKRVKAEDGSIYYLAHGKDPNYPEWADTLQLNYADPDVQAQMEQIVLSLADHSDGLRCDMAMLLNPETFLRTWGGHLTDSEKVYIRENNFWAKVIPKVKEKARREGREFSLIAEAYWDKEILGNNFDFIYAKDLYDHLKRIIKDGEWPGNYLREHVQYLMTAPENGRPYNDVLFTENHDEDRVVPKFGEPASRAATTLTALIPQKGSIFLLNQGQEDGRRIRPPMQIGRFPAETPDPNTREFYERLLLLKRSRLFQEGKWKMAELADYSDQIIALQVELDDPELGQKVGAVVLVNIGHHTASGRVRDIDGSKEASVYRLDKNDEVINPDTNREGGMYVELIPWETQIVFYKSKQ